MNRMLVFVVTILAFLFVGTGRDDAAQNSKWFVAYPHETFVQRTTGMTGLFIDGENWYSLINLNDFEDIDMPFVGPSQFLFQENQRNTRISIFAEKLPKVKNPESCLDHYVPERNQINFCGNRVGIIELNMMTSIHYYPYYKGYCFDIHISAKKENRESDVCKIISSIRFVDGDFSDVVIKKLIYYRDKRIQLLIPDSFTTSYDDGSLKSIPSVVIRPQKGRSFEMRLSIFPSKDGSSVSEELIKRNAQQQMAHIAKGSVNELRLIEMVNDDVRIFYYVAEDKNYKPSVNEDFRFICQGFASVSGSVMYFTILHRESGQDILQQGLYMIANAKILGL